MPFGLQPIHLVIIAIVALLVFGPSKMPELSRNVGRAIAEFRRSSQEITNGIQNEVVKPLTGTIETLQKSNDATTVQIQPTPQDSSPSIICDKCGTKNPTDALFCKKCGNGFPSQPTPQDSSSSIICNNCGTKNPTDALFCKKCGNGFPLPVE